MKVIVAGMPKTGTKSVHAALKELGYSVHDFPEHAYNYHDKWKKILNKGGSIKDFEEMYSDVDAVCDQPACYFWREIHQAFPDSKIILMLRDEEMWFQSLQEQVASFTEHYSAVLMYLFSPTYGKITNLAHDSLRVLFGEAKPSIFKWKILSNKFLMIKKFNDHNNLVLSTAPQENLLVFTLSDGWTPLCRFLNKPVPNIDFPKKNVGSSLLKDYLREHPVYKRALKEAYFGTTILSLILLLIIAILIS